MNLINPSAHIDFTDKPLRVAVWFENQLHIGGSFQQSLNTILLINRLPGELVEPVFITTSKTNVKILADFGINSVYFGMPFLRRLRLQLRRFIYRLGLRVFLKYFARHSLFEKYLLLNTIDIVYFISQSTLALHLDSLNYIFTLFDLCHRDDLEFPEVRSFGEFKARETLFQEVLTSSVAVLVESSVGMRNAIRRYGVDLERVHILPLSPGLWTQISQLNYINNDIDVCSKYSLACPYVFYPAQFWAHKNHVYLLRGLKILKEIYGHEVGAIFAGGDQGNQEYVKFVVQKLGLSEHIRFAGFVPNEEIPYLYNQSIALVMPTYFGPTNMPPLEAFSLGVPVLYSDKHGLRDQVEDAALLMDLNHPSSMAAHLASLIENPDEVLRLVSAGKKLLSKYTDCQRLSVLTNIITDFRSRRICWK